MIWDSVHVLLTFRFPSVHIQFALDLLHGGFHLFHLYVKIKKTRFIEDWNIHQILHYRTLSIHLHRKKNSYLVGSIKYNFMEFMLPPVAYYAKTSKVNFAFTSLDGLLFNCPSWIFHMMYCNSRALLRYNNSSKIACTKPWFFPSTFRKISLFMKVLKIGIFGRFLTEWKMHFLAIFLPNSIDR